jgi:hypothetical protein
MEAYAEGRYGPETLDQPQTLPRGTPEAAMVSRRGAA